MSRGSRSILARVLLSVLTGIAALAPVSVTANPGTRSIGLQKPVDSKANSTQLPQSNEDDTKKTRDRQSLTEAENRLASGSKAAILETGFSASYFERHFRLVAAIDKAADRRVVWKFSINEYEGILSDAIGYYTSEDGRRVDVHSIKDTLGVTHDVEKTISKKEAERIMARCIGKFTSLTVVLQVREKGNAALIMTASPVVKKRADNEKREREEKRKKEIEKSSAKTKKAPELDTIREEEDEGGGEVYFGILDLETGKCTKGKAITAP